MKTLMTMAAAGALLVSAMASPNVAHAGDTSWKIAVGQQGRGYEQRGMELAQRLKLPATGVVNFAGSEDIARAVCEDNTETPVGIVQIDAIYTLEGEGCNMRTLGVYPTEEYAIILFPPGSGKNALHDLDADDNVLVDELGSGTALFWDTIVGIEKGEEGNNSDWVQATPVHDLIDFAESMADTGEITAVIMVGDPNSAEVHALINAGWNAGEFEDKDINDRQFRKGSLYTRESVTIDPPGMGNSDTEEAYVVRSYYVSARGWAQSNRGQLKLIVRHIKTIQ